MVPAQVLTGAVAVLADSRAQSLHFLDQLLVREREEIVVHPSSLPRENCDARRRGVPQQMDISQASTEGDYRTARALFLEYAESLGFSLSYQELDRELEEFTTRY